MSSLQIALYGLAAVFGTAAFSNATVALFRFLKWDRAAKLSAGVLPFVFHAIHIGADAIGAAKSERLKVIAAGIASWAEENDAPELIKWAAKVSAEALTPSRKPPLVIVPIFVLLFPLFLLGCDGSMIPPKTAEAIETVANSGPLLEGCEKGQEIVCEKMTDPEEKRKCQEATSATFTGLLEAVEIARRIWEAVRP